MLSLILLLTGSSALASENDWAKANIKGRVKQYSERIYQAKVSEEGIEKGTLSKESLLSVDRKIYFDEHGNMTRKLGYKANGNLWGWTDYAYDKQGRLVEEWEYDQDGNESVYYSYSYNQEGKLQLQKSEMIQCSYLYDEAGWLVQEKVYSAMDSSTVLKQYKYDKQGNKTEEKLTNEQNGETYYCWSYKYNSKGQKSEEKRSDSQRLVYSYDDKGNIASQTEYDGQGQALASWTYEYEYDEQGNWTQRIDYLDSKPQKIVEREYSYY